MQLIFDSLQFLNPDSPRQQKRWMMRVGQPITAHHHGPVSDANWIKLHPWRRVLIQGGLRDAPSSLRNIFTALQSFSQNNPTEDFFIKVSVFIWIGYLLYNKNGEEMMIARPWEKDNYPIQDALCSYKQSILLFSTADYSFLFFAAFGTIWKYV